MKNSNFFKRVNRLENRFEINKKKKKNRYTNAIFFFLSKGLNFHPQWLRLEHLKILSRAV